VMIVVVSGGGSSTLTLSHPKCSATSISADVQGGGTATVTLAAQQLALSNVQPLGSPRFVGTIQRQGSTIRFQGTSTGTTAALALTC
jgi:hypothetical protein